MPHFQDQTLNNTRPTITERKLKEFIGYIPNAILLVNSRGQITMTNPAAEQLLGYSREELLNMPVEQLIPERFHQAHIEYRAAFQQQMQTRNMGTANGIFALHHKGCELPVGDGVNTINAATGLFMIGSSIECS